MSDELDIKATVYTPGVVGLPGYIDLDVKSAQVTLDERWAPFGQATLVCAFGAENEWFWIDPRDNRQVDVIVYEHDRSRLFQFWLRRRTVNHAASTFTIELVTGERRLQTYHRVNDLPTDDYLAYQNSLRDLVNAVLDDTLGETLQADPYTSGDADLTIYADSVNLITNPSAETNTTGWTTVGCTLTRVASAFAGVTGSYVFSLTTPTTDNNYIYMDVPVTPGETYCYSGDFYLNAGTGTPNSWARRIVITTTTGTGLSSSNQGLAVGTGAFERLKGTVTIPAGVTTVRVRLYGGYPTTETVRWDAIRFSIKTGSTSDHTYFDGATTDTSNYAYDWSGTAHASTSTRTDLTGTNRTADLFTWQPGVDAWEFLEPLVQPSGLRLFCDELQYWHLIKPELYSIAGLPEIETADNLMDATQDVDFASDNYFDAVVVKYTWTTKAGLQRTAYDSAGLGVNAKVFEYRRPYPGPGAAASILARAQTNVDALDLRASANVDVTPYQDVTIQLPQGAPRIGGVVSAVTWRFPGTEMTVTPRDLVETG